MMRRYFDIVTERKQHVTLVVNGIIWTDIKVVWPNGVEKKVTHIQSPRNPLMEEGSPDPHQLKVGNTLCIDTRKKGEYSFLKIEEIRRMKKSNTA